MFRSFPLYLCGAGYRQSRMTLSGNPKGRTTKKMGFPLLAVTYLAENLSGLKNFCSLSFIDRELLCFPLIFFLFTFFRSLIGNPSFPFFSFFFFSSFSFFCFPFLSLGNRVLAFYLLSLEEIPLSFASGERMRILFYRPRFKKV